MAIFAIGDLHMPGNGVKPMDIFGQHWDHHMDTIRVNWLETVAPSDTVLIPGDISWAMQFDDAKADLQSIAALPARKSSCAATTITGEPIIPSCARFLPEGMLALQNDSVAVGDLAGCGTRGWTFPTEAFPLDEQETKIYQRELIRLRMALDHAAARGLPIVAMTHFPPLLKDCRDTAFTALLEEYGVRLCVYGHLHGVGIRSGFNGEHNGVSYRLTSCDALGFAPLRVMEDA
jgi:predicted phosphohydrolase